MSLLKFAKLSRTAIRLLPDDVQHLFFTYVV